MPAYEFDRSTPVTVALRKHQQIAGIEIDGFAAIRQARAAAPFDQ